EVVVVDAQRLNPEAGGFHGPHVAVPWDRAGDAGGPELDVAARPLLERAAADDVGDGDPPARPEDAGNLGEDAVLDRREVDHPVRDDDVEAGGVEREAVDAPLHELGVREAIA